jgi:radical SAM/Cys-rich protein
MPCYTRENVDAQRGAGTFDDSIAALTRLNALGYGLLPELALNLVYNPQDAILPPATAELEDDYRRELAIGYGIVFNRLLTMTNSPIGRFGDRLRKSGKAAVYIGDLERGFNALTLPNLMCRHMISVGWDGRLYDCDFNLALSLTTDHGAPDHLSNFDYHALCGRRIVTGDHCLACTVGAGSSCGGALVPLPEAD